MATAATPTSTPASMIAMNQAARFAALGEGWVMPMVLMKAFERKRRNFMTDWMIDPIHCCGNYGLQRVW